MPALRMSSEFQKPQQLTPEIASWKALLEKPLTEVLTANQLKRLEELNKKEAEVRQAEADRSKLIQKSPLASEDLKTLRTLRKVVESFREEQEELNKLRNRGLYPWQVDRVRLAQKPLPPEVQEQIQASRDHLRVQPNYDIGLGPYFYCPKSKIPK